MKKENNKIICDVCGEEINIDTNGGEFSEESFRDLNWGHECSACKRKRECEYDNYVDPRGVYRTIN